MARLTPLLIAAVVIEFAVSCSSSGHRTCDPAYFSEAVPTGAASTPDGRHVLVAATWFSRPDVCSDGHYGGALHTIDTVSGAIRTIDGLSSLTGRVVLAGSTFEILGNQTNADRYYEIAVGSTSLRTAMLPSPAIDLASDGARAFFLLPGEIVVHGTAATDSTVTVDAQTTRIVFAWGKLFLLTLQGSIKELDPTSLSILGTFAACSGGRSFAPVGGQTLVVACSSNGLNLIDVTSSVVSTISSAGSVTKVAPNVVANRTLFSVSQPGSYDVARILVLGSGMSGSPVPGGIDDESVVFTTSGFAFIASAGDPLVVNMATGADSAIGGFPYPDDFAIVAPAGRGRSIAAGGRQTVYELRFGVVDDAARALVGPPLLLPPPTNLPFQ